MKTALINHLTAKGYVVTDYKKLAVENQALGIWFNIRNISRGSTKHRKLYYVIEGITRLDQPLMFSISKRGFFSKALGVNEGLVPELRDWNINTPNPYQLQSILSNQDFLNKLQYSYDFLNYLESRPYNDYISINAELRYDTYYAIHTIELIELLVEMMRSGNGFIYSEDKIEDYRCFNCGSSISFFGEFCKNCGAIAPKCVICYDDPEPDEDVIMFDCCKSYAHRDHGISWLNKENQCPYCQRESPEIISVIDQPI